MKIRTKVPSEAVLSQAAQDGVQKPIFIEDDVVELGAKIHQRRVGSAH